MFCTVVEVSLKVNIFAECMQFCGKLNFAFDDSLVLWSFSVITNTWTAHKP